MYTQPTQPTQPTQMLASHGAPDFSMLTDPLTLINLGVALTEIFTFLAEPRNVLNTSAACRSWRSLANDEDVWRAKAEEEFGAGSANTAPSCGLAYQRAWIEAAPGGHGWSRLLLAARDGRADVLRCMLRAGPDVNKAMPLTGTTPLSTPLFMAVSEANVRTGV